MIQIWRSHWIVVSQRHTLVKEPLSTDEKERARSKARVSSTSPTSAAMAVPVRRQWDENTLFRSSPWRPKGAPSFPFPPLLSLVPPPHVLSLILYFLADDTVNICPHDKDENLCVVTLSFFFYCLNSVLVRGPKAI